jgi:8-oxo-dGTP pyrophosphatase MutT (NUDIX family)
MTANPFEIFDAMQFRTGVQMLLDQYAHAFGLDSERHALLRHQLAEGDDIHSRRTFPGHVTTSAMILDEEGGRVLLIHHRSLARWLQPGGHYEPPDDLAQSALREAFEETGVEVLSIDPWHAASGIPIDIDSHLIPARPARDEPEHWHHDFRYLVRAGKGSRIRPDLAEVHAAEWRDLRELEAIAPQTLVNMARLGMLRL